MEHELGWRRADLEEQLVYPWEWVNVHYEHLDGWKINNNRINQDEYLQEMGLELGPITIPHRKR